MALADTRLLESLIGKEALQALIQTCGGLSITIPKRLPLSGPLCDLPQHAQEALVRYAGGSEIYVPKCDGARREALYQRIRAEYDSGETVHALARKYQFSERWIYEVLNRPPARAVQAELF